MVVIKRQCEVHLSQEEIDCLEKTADILCQIWSVMPFESYIGKIKTVRVNEVSEIVDTLQELVSIGENIVVKDA